MSMVSTRRAHHPRRPHRLARGRRSDQALFLLIMAMLAVVAVCLGAAASLFQP